MAEQSLKDKTAKGLFWGGVSNGLQQVLGLIFGIILARILNAEDYGMVSMLAIFSAIAANIQDSGFTSALINKKKIQHKDYNAVFWFSLLSGIFMYLILFLLSPLIASFYNKPQLVDLARLVFLGFVFGGASTAHNALLLKNIMAKERAKIDVFALVISGVVGLLLAILGFSYWALAIQSVLYVGIGAVLRYVYVPWRPTCSIDFSPLKEMFGFSFKVFITNVFNQINTNIFSVILGRLYNPIQVGYYAQGQKWMGMGSSFLGGMINSVSQPILSQVIDEKDRQKSVFRKMIRFGAFLSFPLMLGFSFVGEEFIHIALGAKWLPAVTFLQIFCILGAFMYVWGLLGNLLMSHGKSDIYMWGMVLTGCVQLCLILLLSSQGILAMLFAYITVYFIVMLGWILYAQKLIGITVWEIISDFIPYLGITIITFALVWLFTKNIENMYVLFILKVLLSIFLYVLFVWRMNSVIFKECVNYLRKK